MHEYAVTVNILNTVLEEAAKAGATKITEIRLVIGDLSTIMDDSVQLYFDLLSENTPAQGARLVFNRVPAEFLCKACSHVFIKPVKGFDCPKCGELGRPTGRGREFYIESLQVD
jgi:hydrogenase nickel incorporation protein HypA/HybF